MAEDFNSLDPLGPQYGGNASIPTAKNYLPFEGESLKDPIINVPELRPILPGPQPLNNPAYSIKKGSTGAPNYQKPNGQSPNVSRKDAFKAISERGRANAEAYVDKNHYGQTYSYNAGPTGKSFFKRYQAFGQEKFDQIGFAPFRNNDAVFNAGTTWAEKSTRMLTHAAWPLFAPGLTDTYSSLAKMLKGDFSQDLDQSRRNAAASAIGYDSSGGFGSFFNNTAMSFAYTAGIMTSAILEEVAGGLLAPLTGGGSLFAATANNLRKVPLISKGIKAVDVAADAGKAINKTLHGLNDINQTRNLFKSVGNFLNPLENLTGAAKTLYKNEDNFTGLARVYNSTQKTAGALYRDVRALNMALSEARMEGGFVEDDLYRDLYNDYYKRNGYPPTDEAQERMVKQSKEAGMVAVQWNTALIYASNKIVFPNLINPKGGIASFLKGATDDIMTFKTGKIVFEKAKKEAGEAATKTLKNGEFKYVENSFMNTVKAFGKSPLRKSIPGAFSYFKANVTEGLQENAQEVISEATKNYYEATYYNNAVGTYNYAKGLVGEAIKGQFSARGAETFASGLLMGAFAGPLNAIPKWASIGYNKVFDKETYTKYKESREEIANKVTKHLNAVNPKEFFSSKLFNYANQFDAAKSKLSADEKTQRDIQESAFQSHIDYVLETNTMDHFVNEIKAFKQMTPEEFEESFGLEQGTGAERQADIIDSVIMKAERMQKKHNQYKERFPNPIRIDNFRKDSPEYKEAEIYHEAWETARKNAVFFNESFENTASRMEGIINSVSNTGTLKNVSSNDVNVLFDRSRLANEIGMLKTDIETLKETATTPDSKNLLEEKKRKLKALESFSGKFSTYYNFFNRQEIANQIKEINPDISNEELMELVNEKYGDKTEEEADKLTNELKEEFGTYLNALAKPGTKLFNSDIDNAFKQFIDFYQLDKESRSLVDYINLLHDPNGYIEHVNRNAKWMRDLYNNRKGYYKDMVMKALEAKENNDLINHLANQNIYISVDSLQEWLEDGKFPEEFYDDSNNTVITTSNPKYQQYIEVFIRLAAIQNRDSGFTEETADTELQERLNELDKQKAIDIKNLVKSLVREDIGVIEPTGNKKYFSMSMILQESQPGEYIEAIYDTEENPIIYYNDNGILKYDTIDGEVVEVNEDIDFSSAVRFTNIMKADPNELQTIIEKYNALRTEIIDEYRTKPTSETPEVVVEPLSSSTDIDEIKERAPELHTAILNAFNTYYEGLPNVVTENATEEQKQNMFTDYMRTSITVKDLIDEYNKTSKINEANKQTGEVSNFGFMLNGKRINTEDYDTIPKLRTLTYSLDAIIENLNRVLKPGFENINKVSELKAIKNKIEMLIKTRAQSGYSPEMKRAIEQINELQRMQQNIFYDNTYVINDKPMERVTRAIQRFLANEYSYKYMKKVNTAFDDAVTEFLGTNNNTTEPTEALVDTFIEKLKLKQIKGDGISASTLKEVKSDLMSFINRGYISRGNTTTPIQNGIVTATAPTLEDGFVNKYVFEISNGSIISGKQIISSGQGLYQESEIEGLEKKFNDLKQNKKVDYVFTTLSTEEPIDKFNALKEELVYIVAERTYEEAEKAGNYIDASIKQLFAGEVPTFDPNAITEEAYNQLFGETGYLAKIKEMVDTGQYYMVSTGLRVYDEDAGIAGEIDLLLVDQSGMFVIIDVKTGKQEKWEGYNDTTSPYHSAKIENTYQQAAYARLLENMFPGIDVKTAILPIQITYNDETALITSVSKPSDKKKLKVGEKRLLAPGRFIVNLNKNSVKDDIDQLIPLKGTMQVSSDLSAAEKAKLNNFGFRNDMIKIMSTEDIETAKSAKEAKEVKDLVIKYEFLTQSPGPLDDVEVKPVGDGAPLPGAENEPPIVLTGEEKILRSFTFGSPTAPTGKSDIEIEIERLEEERKEKTKNMNLNPFDNVNYDQEYAEFYKINAEYDAKIAALRGTTFKMTSVADVVEELKGINDLVAFNNFRRELNKKAVAQLINPVDLEVMQQLMTDKKAELSDPKNIKLTESNIKVGDKLIVKNTIFKTRNVNEIFAEANTELVVKEVKDDKVKFSHKGSSKTIGLSEINDYFTNMEVENIKSKINTVADTETKATSTSSVSVTDNYFDTVDTNALDEEVKSTTSEDAFARLEETREENCQQ